MENRHVRPHSPAGEGTAWFAIRAPRLRAGGQGLPQPSSRLFSPGRRRPKFLIGVLWLIAVLISANPILLAQADRGAIQGTISDQSAGAIPNATIQVVNIATNSTLEFHTNEVGNYLAPNLPPGTYRLTVVKEGFRSVSQEPVLVRAQSTVRVDFTLQVGSVTETVNVSAEAPLLDVSATSVPITLTNKFVDDMPLINFAQKRNITDLLRFLPGNTSSSGAMSSGEPAESWSARVNSALQGQTEIFIDGAPSSEWGTRRGAILENGPVVEHVAEYAVVANAFNAEYGGFGSWFTTVTLKSGTNQIHGQVFDYFGNNKLNARNFFQGSVIPKLQQNEGGFQVSGPVYIPKVYNGRNRTFLFFGQGFYYSRRGGTGGLQTVPRADFKAGDFSNFVNASNVQIPVFDPSTTRDDGKGGFVRDPFPANRIPVARFAPASAKIVALLPDPDLPLAQSNNWYNKTGTWPTFDTFTSTAKLDHSFSTSNKLSVTYSNAWRPRLINSRGWGFTAKTVPGLPEDPSVLEGFQNQTITSQTWRLNHDYIFSPSVLNHVTIGVDRYVNPYKNTTVGAGWNKALGIQGLPEDLGAFPQITFSGGTASPLAMGLTSNGLSAQTRFSVNQSFTWIRGRHNMKFGFYHWRYNTNNRNQSSTAGAFSFSNLMTSQPNSSSLSSWGNSFASFLLGELSSASTALQSTQGLRFRSFALFAQDDWRVTSNITLSYGLRWDVAPAPYEVHDQVSSFSPAVINPVGVPGALVFAGNGPGRIGRRTFYDTWMRGFAPRLGIAYSLNRRTIIRSSAGIYYADQPASGVYSAGFTSSPSFSSADTFTPVYNWGSAGFPQNFGRPPFLDPAFQNNQSVTWLLSTGTRLPQILSWTFGVQRELTSSLALDIAYIGSHSTHLPSGTTFNFVDKKYLSLGNLLTQRMGTPGAAPANVPMPFPQFPTYSRNTVAHALMPFPQYVSVGTGATNDPVGRAHFHSLQVKATKRYFNGLTFLTFWTWMKNMTDLLTQQYPADIRVMYSGDSPPHVFVLNASYELPIGPQKRFLSTSHPVVSRIAGGWNIAGYFRYSSGSALGFGASNNLSILGYAGKTANYVAGAKIYDKTNPREFEPARDRYLTPGAFVTPPSYEFGNTAPTLDWVRGWRTKAESISIGKALPVNEKVRAQLRLDVNNPFNFVRWSNPNTSITSADYGRVTGSAEGRRVQIYAAIEF